jgi:hypothetical protein
MKKTWALLAAVAMAAGTTVRAEEVPSGLGQGAFVGAFNVNDVTGPNAGKSLCYRCKYGARPVVSIFTRSLDDNVVALIKNVDEQVGKNGEKQMAAFVVLLTDDAAGAEKKLAEVGKSAGIKNVPLTYFDGPVGPPDYKISEKADVNVMMWVKSKVKVNHAYAKGKLSADDVKSVSGETTQILE